MVVKKVHVVTFLADWNELGLDYVRGEIVGAKQVSSASPAFDLRGKSSKQVKPLLRPYITFNANSALQN